MSEAAAREAPRAESNPVQFAKRSPHKHPKPFRRLPAPFYDWIASQSPYNVALRALFPWGVGEYPGILRGARALMLGRAAKDTIRDWRRGKRRAPQWAIDLAAAAIRERMASLAHALAILEKEKGRQ